MSCVHVSWQTGSRLSHILSIQQLTTLLKTHDISQYKKIRRARKEVERCDKLSTEMQLCHELGITLIR